MVRTSKKRIPIHGREIPVRPFTGRRKKGKKGSITVSEPVNRPAGDSLSASYGRRGLGGDILYYSLIE